MTRSLTSSEASPLKEVKGAAHRSKYQSNLSGAQTPWPLKTWDGTLSYFAKKVQFKIRHSRPLMRYPNYFRAVVGIVNHKWTLIDWWKMASKKHHLLLNCPSINLASRSWSIQIVQTSNRLQKLGSRSVYKARNQTIYSSERQERHLSQSSSVCSCRMQTSLWKYKAVLEMQQQRRRRKKSRAKMGLTEILTYKFRPQSSRVSQSRSDVIAMKTYSKLKRRRRASCKRSLRKTQRMVTTQMIKTRLSKTNKSRIIIRWRLWNLWQKTSPHYRKALLKWRSLKRKMPFSKTRQKRAQSRVHPLRKLVTHGRTLSSLSLITLLWQLYKEQYRPK